MSVPEGVRHARSRKEVYVKGRLLAGSVGDAVLDLLDHPLPLRAGADAVLARDRVVPIDRVNAVGVLRAAFARPAQVALGVAHTTTVRVGLAHVEATVVADTHARVQIEPAHVRLAAAVVVVGALQIIPALEIPLAPVAVLALRAREREGLAQIALAIQMTAALAADRCLVTAGTLVAPHIEPLVADLAALAAVVLVGRQVHAGVVAQAQPTPAVLDDRHVGGNAEVGRQAADAERAHLALGAVDTALAAVHRVGVEVDADVAAAEAISPTGHARSTLAHLRIAACVTALAAVLLIHLGVRADAPAAVGVADAATEHADAVVAPHVLAAHHGALAAVGRVGEHVHARIVARREIATALVHLLAHAALAVLPLGAEMSASTAVGVVGLEVRAVAVAVRGATSALEVAHATLAHLALRAQVPARAAVAPVGGEVDARVTAHVQPLSALECAHAALAGVTLPAHPTARAAIDAVDLKICAGVAARGEAASADHGARAVLAGAALVANATAAAAVVTIRGDVHAGVVAPGEPLLAHVLAAAICAERRSVRQRADDAAAATIERVGSEVDAGAVAVGGATRAAATDAVAALAHRALAADVPANTAVVEIRGDVDAGVAALRGAAGAHQGAMTALALRVLAAGHTAGTAIGAVGLEVGAEVAAVGEPRAALEVRDAPTVVGAELSTRAALGTAIVLRDAEVTQGGEPNGDADEQAELVLDALLPVGAGAVVAVAAAVALHRLQAIGVLAARGEQADNHHEHALHLHRKLLWPLGAVRFRAKFFRLLHRFSFLKCRERMGKK